LATCPSYYFVNATYSFCFGCNYACSECTNSSNVSCTACDLNMYRNLSTNSCICIDGYYDNGITQCAPCEYTCMTCNNNTNISCLSCNATFNRTLVNTSCLCSDGYADNNGTCLFCNVTLANCLNCSSNSVCTICFDSYFLSLSG